MVDEEDIARYEARIAELETENRELRQRLTRLERLLGLDSTTSSKPPSSDDAQARTQRKRRQHTGRRPGGQPGHEGHQRSIWPLEQVDEVLSYFPAHCPCGLELEPDQHTGSPVRHQVFEVVPQLLPCTEHRLYACRCAGCGVTSRASLPPSQRSGYGSRLVGLMAYLSARLQATRRKSVALLREVFGLPCSLGSLQGALEQMSEALAPLHQQAREALEQAERVGADETRWACGRQRYWVWVAQCHEAALYLIRPTRSQQAARELLGKARFEVVTVDRYSGYSWIANERIQRCRAHLQREMRALAGEAGRPGRIGQELVEIEACLHGARAQWDGSAAGWQQVVETAQWVRHHQHSLLSQLGERAPPWARWMRSPLGQAEAWRFMDHVGSELTNNTSERALRPVVLSRKLSFGHQSPAGARLGERVWTVMQTCVLQGKLAFHLMAQALEAYRTGQHAPRLVG